MACMCFVNGVFDINVRLFLGGGIVGLSSLNPGPDGKWTVTQIPCHAGSTHNELKNMALFSYYILFTLWSRSRIHKSVFKTINRNVHNAKYIGNVT